MTSLKGCDAAPGAFAYGFPRWLIPALVPPLALAAAALLALWTRRAAALAVTGLLILLVSGLPSQGVSLAVGDDYLFLAVGLAFLTPDAAFVARSYLPSLILLTPAVVTACRRPLRPA